MDLAKYRNIFIEESAEHFAEMSGALLALEKDPACGDAIDLVFRMAHSIKGMAASLGYESIAEVAHRLEDRMQAVRSAGRVGSVELSRLFRGLEALEAMLVVVKDGGEPPAADPVVVAELSSPSEAGPASEPESAPHAGSPPVPAAQPPRRAATLEAPTPPPSVRVRTDTLDRFLSTVGEVILNSSQVRTSAREAGSRPSAGLSERLDRMDRVVGELQRSALELRTTKLLRIVEPLPRMAREVAQRAGKRVEVDIDGAELELDRSILDRLSDPLVHLLRNAVDHGIELPERRTAAGKHECGRITIEARREKDSIRITVADDGAGIDLEAVRGRAVASGLIHPGLAEDLPPDQVAALVFQPGLSTSESISDISGRGVGMDAVRATIESLGGAVEIASDVGSGTRTSLIVPITAAVQRVLLLGLGGETVAIPIAKVERIIEVEPEAIERSGHEAFSLIDGELVPVLELARQIGLTPPPPEGGVTLALTQVRGERVALTAERVVGQHQIYLKPVPELLAGIRTLAGLTILGDGRPMFLLDLNQLA